MLPVALLLVAAWYQGAFAVQYWAPVAVLALAVLAATAATGGLRVDGAGARTAIAAAWALALWALLSALWAESPSGAVEGASRTALYAALLTIPLALTAGARSAARVAVLLQLGIAAIAAVTFARLLGDGTELFLAGRLDDPVGYRNATGCLFALGFWPFVAWAARRDMNAFARASSLAGAVLLLGLAFLTQARGIVPALAVGGAIALALGPERLRRAWLALAAVAAVAAVSGRLLTPFRAFSDGGEVGAADIAVAVDALALAIALTLVAGLVVALVDGGLRLHERTRLAARRALRAGLALVAAGVAIGSLAAVGDVGSFLEARAHEFRTLETSTAGETRLAFGGGQRADLWRVALIEMRERPLTGVGEGSYRFGYYQERRSDRNLSAPHSLVFRVAAELGAVGLLCLLAVVGGIAVAVARRWGSATADGRRNASALLALGAVGAVQGAVDWLWLVPAVTGLSVLALGLAVAALEPEPRPNAPSARPAPPWARAVTAAALALVAGVVALTYLGDVYVREARAVEPDRPRERLEAARRAERVDPLSTAPLHLQASALEDLGRRAAARRRLRGALDLEPRSFVAHALIGDLETRAGRPAVARAHYRRALSLNPRDIGLRKLARPGR